MKKISSYIRRELEDALYFERKTENQVKRELMIKYRYPARLARKETDKLLSEAMQYWMYEDVY